MQCKSVKCDFLQKLDFKSWLIYAYFFIKSVSKTKCAVAYEEKTAQYSHQGLCKVILNGKCINILFNRSQNHIL